MPASDLLREDPMASDTPLSQEGARELFVGSVGGVSRLYCLAFVRKDPGSARRNWDEKRKGMG